MQSTAYSGRFAFKTKKGQTFFTPFSYQNLNCTCLVKNMKTKEKQGDAAQSGKKIFSFVLIFFVLLSTYYFLLSFTLTTFYCTFGSNSDSSPRLAHASRALWVFIRICLSIKSKIRKLASLKQSCK